ncbi:MAG: extracellular solute-binding protein [Oscillospiraceae bacterium]|nr:extracellular solute-binding protein [Oscillospiraceae bacterium]
MRNLKAYLWTGVVIVLAVLLGLSMFAPHGADVAREPRAAAPAYELNPHGSGILLQAGEGGVQLSAEPEEWTFTVSDSGSYYINVGYQTLGQDGRELDMIVLVDGKPVCDEAVTLTRLWTDDGVFRYTAAGDEIRPSQLEANTWAEEPLRVAKSGRLSLELSAGEHTIALGQKDGNCLVEYVRIFQEELIPYAQYASANSAPAAAADLYLQIEGENASLKSSSQLHSAYDRSSPYTIPYHATCLRYNTIGGETWADNGQWIEWEVEVPADGLYQLGLRYRQNVNKGQDSLRRLEVDGQVPFAEAALIPFDYAIDWQTGFLGGDEPWQLYLTAGTHRIRLEVVQGEKEAQAIKMQETLYQINTLYREIIMITGTDPDTYRDYSLETAIPDLDGKLHAILSELQGYISYLEDRYGEGCYSSRILSQMELQFQSFIDEPYTIARRLSMFKTNIEALAEWILEFQQQALQIDYLYVTGVGAENPIAEGSFLSRMGHEVHAFLGSFTHSYNDVSTAGSENADRELTIWMGKGRDQANVVKRLIDAYFTPESGINVNISLVEGALVKATLAGQGPDVNIFTSRGEAMNLAFRGAITPVDGMEGFEEMTGLYSDSAFVPYVYEGQTFAVPETQEFYVMYVRTDIMNELGLQIPNTWKELMALLPVLQSNSLSIGLPYTDGYATMNSGIGTINLLPTLLAQKGISVYNEDGDTITTNLMTPGAYDAFKQWSDFYVLYDFALYKDDFNRFRTGEMPIVISSYALYNTLEEAAPEIAGQWIMTSIPGTPREDGTLDRSTSASGTCTIILNNCKDEAAAWEFVRWWNSAEVQEMYARDVEAELSTLGRHTPANLDAFRASLWSDEEKALLLQQWENVVEVPEIPGGYYVSRNIDNAFRQVFYNGENARDTLNYWMNAVDEELARKQLQLDQRKGD